MNYLKKVYWEGIMMKNRVKLYKAGKLWVTALVAAAGIAFAANNAYADQTQPADSNVQISQVTTNQQSSIPDSINGYTKQQDQSGNNVWKNQQGQALNGWQTADNNWYHFNNGSAQTGWQNVNNNWYYMNKDSSAMETGLKTIDNNTYYLNTNHDGTYGAMKTGWQSVDNNWYHFADNGAAQTGWQNLDNNWYYFAPTGQGKMLTGLQTINQNHYYLNTNHDGTYGAMKTGWQNVDNNWYYFANNGAAYTGWQRLDNNWYYFAPSDQGKMLTGIQKIDHDLYYLNTNHDGTYGAMKTGWQYVGNHWYGFKSNGAAYTGWQTLNGNVYYFNPNNGQMATGDVVINGSHYYFEPASGHQIKGIVLDGNGLLKYYDVNTGARATNLSSNGKNYSFDATTGDIQTNGLADGLNTIANHVYYFNKSLGRFVANAWEKVNNNWYHFDNQAEASTGWFESPAHNWYFFNNDGSAKTGWFKSAAGFWYYFDPQNAWALKDWQKINNNWYHFDTINTWADTGWYKSAAGNWYYFDPVNAWANTGWFRSGVGNWYYFDQTNAWALTGWQKINNNWYYFDPTNAWAERGYHRINGVDYYFDTTNANMYQNRWVNVNGWTYHADNSGHLWFPRWYCQFSPIFTADGCSVFSLAMMLSPKEYINIPYALNLLSARQAGNIYTGAGFWRIIQPDSLVDLAHHFDSTVTNISGSSINDIINIVNSGRPVLYYGYSSFEQSYAFRNHAKVIVGYQNGWFRVYDPCYALENEGPQGRNAYDYGPKGWITTAQLAREYAGQAITVD